ncbi:MAG: nuclear transport factor 2 family protein [Hespellia sp.]|nr:nuclear transport factor 2 family protein [Hespellia sp.]
MTVEERLEVLEKEVQRLKDIEAIKCLKGKYFRCMDGKDWEGFASTMSPNIHTSYSDGKLVFDGPEAVAGYISENQPKTEITLHMGHTPEISFESETQATGRWYLQDKLIFCKGDPYEGTQIDGAAFYIDKYEKIDGQWYILETGYQRVYEQMSQRDPSIKITRNMHMPRKKVVKGKKKVVKK